MLSKLLEELKSTSGPIYTSELSRKLGIEESALLGMIDLLVKKGMLQDDKAVEQRLLADCSPQSCGTCSGAEDCALVVKTLRTYSLKVEQKRNTGD